jgi:hypothetical protein
MTVDSLGGRSLKPGFPFFRRVLHSRKITVLKISTQQQPPPATQTHSVMPTLIEVYQPRGSYIYTN